MACFVLARATGATNKHLEVRREMRRSYKSCSAATLSARIWCCASFLIEAWEMLMTNQANQGGIFVGFRNHRASTCLLWSRNRWIFLCSRWQAVLHRDGARGFAVTAAVVLRRRRKSIFPRSVHALKIGCVGQIWTELELYCCCGTAMLAKLFVLVWFVLKLYFLAKKKGKKRRSKWRNYILK